VSRLTLGTQHRKESTKGVGDLRRLIITPMWAAALRLDGQDCELAGGIGRAPIVVHDTDHIGPGNDHLV